MPRTQNLLDCSLDQMQDFLNSFDVILSDCDGVLWHITNPIDGAIETANRLQQLGKKLYLVSNNSTFSVNHYCEKTRKRGLNVNPEQIIITSKVVAWYLKKINFQKEALTIATTPFQNVLRDAGMKLTNVNLETEEYDPVATVKAVEDRPSIGAVIIDFSLRYDWAKLALAISCLKRKDVLYLCGAQEDWVVCGSQHKVLGPGPLINVITKHAGRTPTDCAKPSEVLRDYVLEVCNLHNPRRCLLIGDSINHDMKFGAMCDFIKLFVGSGCDKLEEAQAEEETTPNFYIPSLGMLLPHLNALHRNSTSNQNS